MPRSVVVCVEGEVTATPEASDEYNVFLVTWRDFLVPREGTSLLPAYYRKIALKIKVAFFVAGSATIPQVSVDSTKLARLTRVRSFNLFSSYACERSNTENEPELCDRGVEA